MKGNNTILLNEATARDVVQFYFDKVLFREGASPVVTGVLRGADGFIVNVEERPVPKEATALLPFGRGDGESTSVFGPSESPL